MIKIKHIISALLIITTNWSCNDVSAYSEPIPHPTAVISGLSEEKPLGKEIILDGSLSRKYIYQILSYKWEVTSPATDNNETITDAEQSIARFTPLHTGAYTFTLTVSSEKDGSGVQSTVVTVK